MKDKIKEELKKTAYRAYYLPLDKDIFFDCIKLKGNRDKLLNDYIRQGLKENKIKL